jgi:hypothetical protein
MAQQLEPQPCKHTGSSCGETCECTCDDCQAVYEAAWGDRAKKEGLCDSCGMPQEPYSLDRLAQFQYVHFYSPCQACAPGYRARMAVAGLCAICRRTLTETGDCEGCKSSGVREERREVQIDPNYQMPAAAAAADPPEAAEES